MAEAQACIEAEDCSTEDCSVADEDGHVTEDDDEMMVGAPPSGTQDNGNNGEITVITIEDTDDEEEPPKAMSRDEDVYETATFTVRDCDDEKPLKATIQDEDAYETATFTIQNCDDEKPPTATIQGNKPYEAATLTLRNYDDETPPVTLQQESHTTPTTCVHDDDNDASDDDDDTPKPYNISDYFDIHIDDVTGTLRNTFTCPRPDALCDGFTFASLDECLAHEQDWHTGPYTCLICGRTFPSAPRLRRHDHYAASDARRADIAVADRQRGDSYGVRVYHGNLPARRRAGELGRLLRKEEKEKKKMQGKTEKRMVKEGKLVLKKERSVRNKNGELVVVGLEEKKRKVKREDEEEREGAKMCEEPCCPSFERHFGGKAHERHLVSHGHQVAVSMGAALLQQMMAMLSSRDNPSSTTANDYHRASTPPPQQLLSPPPTPHGPDEDADGEAWDETEKLPMMMEQRLARTQAALRELRCNAPGCWLYGEKLATSVSYWGHLASETHSAALKAWSGIGGDAVYVSV